MLGVRCNARHIVAGPLVAKGRVYQEPASMTGGPRPTLDAFPAEHDQASPRLADGQAFHSEGPHLEQADTRAGAFWGNAKPPTPQELVWIKDFGRYADFDPRVGGVSGRLSIEIADLKMATRVIVYHHYLHRGRTMAQLPYWVRVDGVLVGVVLYALPRLSVPLDGFGPMNILELARMWISPDLQNRRVVDSRGRDHSVAVSSAAVGKTLRVVRQDWFRKYPGLPDIYAVVSWADTVHHEGTVYRAANFSEQGRSGGTMHGSRTRHNGGRDQMNPDYSHVKTRFLYKFAGPLADREKRRIAVAVGQSEQLQLFG
jgi:hypothetical protein